MRKYQIRYVYPTSVVSFPKLSDAEQVASIVNTDLKAFETVVVGRDSNITFNRLSKEILEAHIYSRVTIAITGQHTHIPIIVEVVATEETV